LKIERSQIEQINTFSNKDGLDDEAVSLENFLNVDLEAASDIQVANNSCATTVEYRANTNEVYNRKHGIAILKIFNSKYKLE
jgi:hypothetical protein